MSATKLKISEEEALRLLVEGTASETGVEFFRALVKNLATVTEAAGAWVTEYLPHTQRLNAYAFWLNGKFIDNFEYPIAGTACEAVVESKTLVHIPDRLLDIYPGDEDAVKLNVVSYLGVPLLDPHGEVMGHLSILDTKPMPKDSRLISLFNVFAARAAAEQRRLRQELELRVREEELTALLDSAMDAVVVLDEANNINRLNPAAERVFGCTAEDLVGENLRGFMPEKSAAQFMTFVKEVDAQPEDRRHVWVPQSLSFMRWDKSCFPAEATISRFTNRGKAFHTVILRNVDERIAAEQRLAQLTEETEYLRESVRELTGMGDMLGSSPAMTELFESLKRVAVTDATVLVAGETGTGKELIARCIHEASLRKEKALVRVNCAAIPGTLMESEFFGHERGAFTGATTKREGRFGLADGGTIFLDEVGELPLDLQAKLLRVLQEGEFEPLGSAVTRKVDVRVIAATNRDLFAMAREGKFREDLYYRLNVFPVTVPPLRERGSDIAVLARSFAERFARRMGRRLEPLHPDDFRRLQDYRWPGNVRELQNVIERGMIFSNGSRIDLNRAMPAPSSPTVPMARSATEADARILNSNELASLEKANIERALEMCGGRISGDNGAAVRLGLPPSTLNSRMKALGILRHP
jgi:PAS domain S-box-containing protein